MRNVIILLFLIILIGCIASNTNDQSKSNDNILENTINVFDSYDFNSGDYSLYILSDKIVQSENKSNYYTNDKEILKKLKNLWDVNQISYGRCSPGYILYLLKKDSICLKFKISTKCEDLFLFKTQYKFNSKDLFVNYLKEFKPLYYYSFNFKSMEERYEFISRNKFNSIVLNELGNINNIKFKFICRFNYSECIDSNQKWNFSWDTISNKLTKHIKMKFETEDFILESSYGSFIKDIKKGNWIVNLYCNKSLYDRFNLFKKVEFFDKDSFCLTFYSTENVKFK